MTMWLQSHLAKRTQAINTSSLQSQHTMLVFPRSRCNKAVTEQFTPLYAMVINSNTAQSDLYFVANGAVTVAGDILITVPVYPPPRVNCFAPVSACCGVQTCIFWDRITLGLFEHFTSPCPELLEVSDELDDDLQDLVSRKGRFRVALWAAGVVLVCTTTRVWVLL